MWSFLTTPSTLMSVKEMMDENTTPRADKHAGYLNCAVLQTTRNESEYEKRKQYLRRCLLRKISAGPTAQ